MAQSGALERASDRWFSIILSVLLHGALVVAFAYGWWFYKRDRPTPTLAIDAAVVDARTVPGLGNLPPQPQAAPPPPPEQPPPQPQETQPQVEPDGPPQPTPEELAKREQEQKEQADREAKARQQEEDQKRLEQERQQEAALAQEKAAEQQRAEERRLAEEQEQKRAAEKAEAERKDREAAEAKQREEQKRLAAEKEAEEQRQAQEKAEREADLRRSLDQELRQDAAQRSGALASWQAQITARIQRAWLKPESARPGIECVLDVTQVPGGEVTNVRIGTCNGDQAVRESIEAAVYRASPLPPPPDPSLFQRELVITFRPN